MWLASSSAGSDGMCPVGQSGKTLRNAIIWADQRATEQERWVGERIAPETVYRISAPAVEPRLDRMRDDRGPGRRLRRRGRHRPAGGQVRPELIFWQSAASGSTFSRFW